MLVRANWGRSSPFLPKMLQKCRKIVRSGGEKKSHVEICISAILKWAIPLTGTALGPRMRHGLGLALHIGLSQQPNNCHISGDGQPGSRISAVAGSSQV